MSKDRLSIHQDNGEPQNKEAFTIMRDGGSISQSGLVGITNSGYLEGDQPILPETIFNVQSSRQSHIRFSSGPSGVYNPDVESSIQILGNGNTLSSGIKITYYPDCDSTTVNPCVGDCDSPQPPVFKKYTLIKCDNNGESVFVYDPLGLNPSVNDVVSYTDANGSDGCGTVNTSSFSSSTDNSQINQNFGADGCSVCEGLEPPLPLVYSATICGTSDQILLSNPKNFDLTGGPVVKFLLEGDLKCATVSDVAVFGFSQSSIDGIASGGCSDSDCVPPEPPTRKWLVELCDNPGTFEVIEDDSGNLYQNGNVVSYTVSEVRTCVTIQNETTNAVDVTATLSSVYPNGCVQCNAGDSSLVEAFICRFCDENLPNTPFGWLEIGPIFNPLLDGQIAIDDVVKVNITDTTLDLSQYGLTVPGIHCMTVKQQMSDSNYLGGYDIISEHNDCASCESGSGSGFIEIRLRRCDGSRPIDVVTIPSSQTPPTPDPNISWSYTISGTDYCGTVLSVEYNKTEIANTSLNQSYSNCTACLGSSNSEEIMRVVFSEGGPADAVYDSEGNCLGGACGGEDCGDYCEFYLAYISTGPCDPTLFEVGDFIEVDWHDTPAPVNATIGKITALDVQDETSEGEVVENPNCTIDVSNVPGNILFCHNCDTLPLGNGNGGFLMLPPENNEEQIYGSSSQGGGTASDSKATPNVGGSDLVVADFSLVRPSGTEGFEFGHLSFTERGYVGVGLTKANKSRLFTPNAPLTVNYAAYQHRDSGTISMRAQSSAPNNNGNYGKVYVKPFTSLGGSQALFFKDDAGVETNLLTVADIDCCEIINNYKGPSGMVYGDTNFNTYAGWNTPKARGLTTGIEKNTFYGQAAGFDLVAQDSSVKNTLIGFSTGSGAVLSSGMTVVGSDSFVNYATAKNSVIIGHNNVKSTAFVPAEDVSSPMSGIIIGTNLYVNSDPPTGILAIGHGFTPVVTGQLTGDASERSFAVDDATFIVSTGSSYELRINQNQPYTNFNTVFTSVDKNSTGTNVRDAFQFDVSNSDGYTVTLLEMKSIGSNRSNTPTYADQGFMWTQINTDLRLKGAIRFQDGTSLSGVPDWAAFEDFSTSGVGITTYGDYRWFTLDFTELQLAQAVSNNVRTDNTFVAVQLDGTSSTNVGKMSLQGLADYVSDSFTNISENCNVILTDPENAVDLNATANSESVFIGCEVGTRASGWKNSVIIGNEAGWEATTPNPTLSTSTAAVFLGYRAGYDSDNTDNTIFIGTAAGRDADAASDSIFVGASAGLGSSYSDSIGIGQNSLRGAGVGEGNIEIVANLLDNQRLFHNAGNVDNRLNIQNIIAGDTSARFLSIGDARLSPEAPLEARRDSTIHSTTNNSYIQSWHHDDAVVGAVESDGSLSGFVIEGVLTQTLAAPSNTALSTTANLEIYYNGSTTSQTTTITNRDPGFNAGIGAYILAIRIGGEYRPMNATCCGAGGIP